MTKQIVVCDQCGQEHESIIAGNIHIRNMKVAFEGHTITAPNFLTIEDKDFCDIDFLENYLMEIKKNKKQGTFKKPSELPSDWIGTLHYQ